MTLPQTVIDEALALARSSPCAKSHRGAVVFQRLSDTANILGRGFNGPPIGHECGGAVWGCLSHCNKVAVHAEQRAIRDAARMTSGVPLSLVKAELVHVKADLSTGALVAGGGPSCWQCSREVADVGLAAVWLHQMTCKPGCLGDPGLDCNCGRMPIWRRYTATEFHRATLRACALPGGAA